MDPELGDEGFTYRLRSGAVGSIHMDSVLEHNEDPSQIAELKMYGPTQEVRRRFEASGLTTREVAR